MKRRKLLKGLTISGAGISLIGSTGFLVGCDGKSQKTSKNDQGFKTGLFFMISLAQWSLNHSFFGESRKLPWPEFGRRLTVDPDSLLLGDLDPINFPVIARRDFDIEAVEYVNTFYMSKKNDQNFWNELKSRSDGEGITNVMIMCDAEGDLGDPEDNSRNQAVDNHKGWVDIAKFLGCQSIRVNASGNGTPSQIKEAAVDGIGKLSEYAGNSDINILIENHGGMSSNARWLSGIIEQVNVENCGTLPDFGNFCMERGPEGCEKAYDMYRGVRELMPFAKGVSAKAYDFDEEGNETTIDYSKMLDIVKNSGFTGYIGIEYEGKSHSESKGISATKKLLERVGAEV